VDAQVEISADVTGTVPGGTAAITLALASHDQLVSAVQFDLQWSDRIRGISPVLDNSPRASGKLLYVAQLDTGTLRVVIAGPNAATIADGPLVTVFVSMRSDTPAALYTVGLGNAVIASPGGESVGLITTDPAVAVAGGGANLLSGDAVLNAASLLPGPIAPGEVVTLFGPGSTLAAGQDFSVTINGISATVLYVGPNQINFTVPFGVQEDRPAVLDIAAGSLSVSALTLPVVPVQPAIFTQNLIGVGPGVILNEDATLNSADNAAPIGSKITIYSTGFGRMKPNIVAANNTALDVAVSCEIGGVDATVVYAGTPSGTTEGVFVVTAIVPAGIATGPETPVFVRVGTATSQAGVVVALR
jgi:uncharacterized protein (TIGR03437 family)